MSCSPSDVLPSNQARALAAQAEAGAEKVISKNGERCVALIDAARLDDCRRLERERVHASTAIRPARRGSRLEAGRGARPSVKQNRAQHTTRSAELRAPKTCSTIPGSADGCRC